MDENLDELKDDNYHVLRFDHDDCFNPFLLMWDCKNAHKVIFPILDKEFSIEISNNRYCISTIYVDKFLFNYCGKKLTKNYVECKKCYKLDYFNLCSICNGSKCHFEEKKCVTPYVVYLALFGNVVKVGVSKSHRYLKRTFEQGADYSTIIANVPDGLLARKIERQIINQFKIKDKMNITQKIKLLCTRADQKILIETANKLSSGISKFSDYLVKTQKISDLNSYRAMNDLKNIPLENKGKIVNGRIIGTKGYILFIEDLKTVSILNIGRILHSAPLLNTF